MIINRLDHLVLAVADITTTCNFYAEVLGMHIETFGKKRKALCFGKQKINLHQKGKEIEPKAFRPTEGSADLCFIADTPIREVRKQLRDKGITLVEGIVTRTGATGPISSVYFRGPDGNLIEVSNYKTDEL